MTAVQSCCYSRNPGPTLPCYSHISGPTLPYYSLEPSELSPPAKASSLADPTSHSQSPLHTTPPSPHQQFEPPSPSPSTPLLNSTPPPSPRTWLARALHAAGRVHGVPKPTWRAGGHGVVTKSRWGGMHMVTPGHAWSHHAHTYGHTWPVTSRPHIMTTPGRTSMGQCARQLLTHPAPCMHRTCGNPTPSKPQPQVLTGTSLTDTLPR